MPLCSVQARDFRRFRQFELACSPHINWLVGSNGSGKTSILECLFLLSRGKSFRTTRRQALWRHGTHGFGIKAKVTEPVRGLAHLTVSADAQAVRSWIQGEPVRSMSVLAGLLPIQLMDPRLVPLVGGTPSDRRRFIDWGLFHVEPLFHAHWRGYNRALEQRNAALRLGAPDDVVAGWELTLCREGETITALRHAHLKDIAARFSERALMLNCPPDLELRYHPGHSAGQTLKEALLRSRERDRQRGITSVGPHRADVDIRIDQHPANQVLSRGEEKRISYGLLLAQVDVFHQYTGAFPILLIDDPAAELDLPHWQRLTDVLADLPAQQFITTLGTRRPAAGESVFHVEQMDGA